MNGDLGQALHGTRWDPRDGCDGGFDAHGLLRSGRLAYGFRGDAQACPTTKSEERLDRESIELLNELRVMLPRRPGALRVPARCASTGGSPDDPIYKRDIYFLTFMCAAAGYGAPDRTVCLSRLTWRQADVEHLLMVARTGFGDRRDCAPGACDCGTVFVSYPSMLFDAEARGTRPPVSFTVFFASFWYALPSFRRARRPSPAPALGVCLGIQFKAPHPGGEERFRPPPGLTVPRRRTETSQKSSHFWIQPAVLITKTRLFIDCGIASP